MSLARNWRARLRWLRRSSTLRLTVVLSAIFAFGFIVAIFVALSLGERVMERRVDATLITLAQSTSVGQAPRDNPAMIMRRLDNLSPLPRALQDAARRGGGTVALQDELMDSDLWRVLVTEDQRGTPVMVAVPLEDSAEMQELLEGILWTTASIVIAATLAIGLWAGFRAQRRLARINATLAQLASGDLAARTHHTRTSDDLDDIARNLDQTAAGLERLVMQTRHLSASIAHDLRTPLARLRARLEVLPEGEARGAALEEAERLSGIFDTIMRVARIEAGQGQEGFAQIALDQLAEDLAETFGPVIEDEGKSLSLHITSAQSVLADRGMLVQAVANLIQNALVHGGDEITLFVHDAQIGVADNGHGVDPARYGDIVKPMVRLDEARNTQGTGLGLALVRAVADRHGAALELSSNDPQGLRVAINFTKK